MHTPPAQDIWTWTAAPLLTFFPGESHSSVCEYRANVAHIHVVALSPPAQNARLHFPSLAWLQFAARVQLLPAVNAIAKWVSSDIVKFRALTNHWTSVFKIPEVKFLIVGFAACEL